MLGNFRNNFFPILERNSFIKHYLAEGLRKTSKTAYLDMIEEENFEEFGVSFSAALET